VIPYLPPLLIFPFSFRKVFALVRWFEMLWMVLAESFSDWSLIGLFVNGKTHFFSAVPPIKPDVASSNPPVKVPKAGDYPALPELQFCLTARNRNLRMRNFRKG